MTSDMIANSQRSKHTCRAEDESEATDQDNSQAHIRYPRTLKLARLGNKHKPYRNGEIMIASPGEETGDITKDSNVSFDMNKDIGRISIVLQDHKLIEKMRVCPYFRLTGNTPLVRLSSKIYAKVECYNPSGSIKDRIIKYIVRRGVLDGEIRSNTVLCEATSGNTGIALAACGAALGLKVVIYMPCNMTENRKILMRKFGATLHEVGPNDFLAAVAARDKQMASDVDTYWSPRQFDNENNVSCHLFNTCVEVEQQLPTGFVWDAFIHGAGTGGTMTAFMKFKEQEQLNFKSLVVEPAEDAESHGIQGIYDGADFLLNRSMSDGVIKVTTESAKIAADIIAKKFGLLVGISSGANYVAARQYVKQFKPAGCVVTIFADRGERYM